MTDLDQQIAAAERRLESLKAIHPSITAFGFTAITLEQEVQDAANSGELKGRQFGLLLTKDELSRRYRAFCQAYDALTARERQLLAGLRMEKKAEDTHATTLDAGTAGASTAPGSDTPQA